jgi:hypothetical protein
MTDSEKLACLLSERVVFLAALQHAVDVIDDYHSPLASDLLGVIVTATECGPLRYPQPDGTPSHIIPEWLAK